MTKADDDLDELQSELTDSLKPQGELRPLCLLAAQALANLRAQLAAAEVEGKEATKLLLRWSELSGAEDAAAGPDTFAFLGKENSAGWVWAREIKKERDFDAEQNRLRDLAMQCVTAAEERALAAESKLQAMRKALDEIAPAVESLARHQEQCDADGIMVIVSRQAVDEVVNAINEMAIGPLRSLTEGAKNDK